jgi:hypothetical protein
MMFYRAFGWWIRWQACKMAAQVMQGRSNGDEAISPLVWSLAVFFEQYMLAGATETSTDFGPKQPVELKPVA